MAGQIKFEVGGRYRNRTGWYEVLEIIGNEIKVRYENNGVVENLSIGIQTRIISNITFEEESLSPYKIESNNRQYFKTLGYISQSCMIEAILPSKSVSGFESNYYKIKGHLPQKGSGYYIHGENVKKWGVEMRLTFTIPQSIAIDELDFGGSVTLVKSPEPNMLRINNNEFCYKLLQLGFDLGTKHDTESIKHEIPEHLRSSFEEGLSLK